MIKLSRVARDLGVSKMTLWNWKSRGLLNFHKIGSMNFITTDDFHRLQGVQNKKAESVVIYARVSSSENKDNLERQKNRLLDFCAAKGYTVSSVVTEIASA